MNKVQAAMAVLGNGYEGTDIYTGLGDPALQFDGAANSFADEGRAGLVYNFQIENKGVAADDILIAICPGYFVNAADIKGPNGVVPDVILAEGELRATADKKVIAKGLTKSLTDFVQFTKHNPTRFTGLKVKVDDPEQLDEPLHIIQLSPFRDLQTRQIVPSTFTDSTKNNDKMAEVPLDDFQMDNNTVVLIKIKAGRTAWFTFFAGAIKNNAAELDIKAKVARQNLARTYGK